MKNFDLYLTWGIQHILTWQALDHILFVAALCLRYPLKQYKKLLLLITAFTVGHSSTLLISSFSQLAVKTSLTEFLIALTILITAIGNVWEEQITPQRKVSFVYFIALIFGMIHGLGFAYGLKSILGHHDSIVVPLLAFNCGIEIAQVVISFIVLGICFIFVRILQVPSRTWLLFTSGIIFGLALQMVVERYPF